MSERQKQLEARVRETPLPERLKECQRRIGNMCAERRGPKMSIPVEHYDDDFYICTTLQDAITAHAQGRREGLRLAVNKLDKRRKAIETEWQEDETVPKGEHDEKDCDGACDLYSISLTTLINATTDIEQLAQQIDQAQPPHDRVQAYREAIAQQLQLDHWHAHCKWTKVDIIAALDKAEKQIDQAQGGVENGN